MDLFNNISIKTRLWLIMCSMALMMLVGGIIALTGLSMTDNALNDTYKNSLQPTKLISRILLLMDDNRAEVMLWLQHKPNSPFNDKPLATLADAITHNRDEIAALLIEFKKSTLTAEEQRLADNYLVTRGLYFNEGLLPAIAALQAGKYQYAHDILLNKINPHYETANFQATALLQKVLETARTRYDQAKDRYFLIRNILIGSTLLGLLLISIAAMLLVRSIVRPLNQAILHFQDIALGKLDVNIDITGKDEVGQVLGALATMQKKLKVIIDELDRLASTDKLTGSWNRRRLEETTKDEMDRLKRYDHPLSMIMFDIDFFKHINDQYGHGTGDLVLVELTSKIRSALRSSDSLTRWGGEEFIVLCPNTTLSTAALLAERLRNKIAGSKFPEVTQVTVSISVAECGIGESWEQWLKRADEALYRAKSGGRNQVRIAPGIPGRTGVGEKIAANFVRLIWHKSYECGNEVIDHEHQRLFNIANELLTAILSGRPAEDVKILVESLSHDIIKHFQDEEIILAKAGYPDITGHAAIHRKFLKETAALVDRFHADTLGIGELFNFLAQEVIAKHILGADREYFPYLNTSQSIEYIPHAD